MLKLKNLILIFLPLLMMSCFEACESPNGPVVPPIKPPYVPMKYVELGEVIYIRELPITCPEAGDTKGLILKCEKESVGYGMEKIGPETWRVYITQKVLVNYPEEHNGNLLDEHEITVLDSKLYTGKEGSNVTGYGIYINNQKVLRTRKEGAGTKGIFRIDENKNLH